MFICELCLKQSELGEPSHLLITEKRNQEYVYVIEKILKGERITQKRVTKGWEIVKEKRVCGECYYAESAKNSTNTGIDRKHLATKPRF